MNISKGLFSAAAFLVTLGLDAATGQLTFVDLAPATGTTNLSFGRGSAMVDLDDDGLLDLIAGNAGMPSGFFRQNPDHTFTDANLEWGIPFDDRSTWGTLAADYDNDGDIDVYFLNGGRSGQQVNQVLRNDIGTLGVFTDVSVSSGDGDILSWNWGGTTLDYDLDGHLDVFLTTLGGTTCVLLRNDGGLVFTDVSADAGMVETGAFRHCTTGDFDNDGWIDIGVGVGNSDNLLYRNNGDGTFTDVAAQVGATQALVSAYSNVLEDFDNDGWLDLLVPNHSTQAASELLRNNGDGTFTNVTAGSGMTANTDMGHTTGDLDGDGYPDIYIGTGGPTAGEFDKLFLVEPDGVGGFFGTDVTVTSGIQVFVTRCHGTTMGDYDQDGFVDLYVNNGGPDTLPLTTEENFLFHNQGNDNNWTAIELTGVLTNRGGVGTHSVAYTSAGREVHRYHRVGHGFANTHSPIQHFGIGLDASVSRLEVLWPSGITQVLLRPTMSVISQVTETGIRLIGDPQIGEQVSLQFVGPPDDVALSFLSFSNVSVPLQKYGGFWQLGEPMFPLLQLDLGASGINAFDVEIPDDQALVGVTAYVQAWIHAPGTTSGGTLANAIAVDMH